MKPKYLLKWTLLLLLSTINSQPSAWAQGTAFTYQGRLTASGSPANGSYDLQFYLRDALVAGNPVGATNTVAPVAASNGLFTVTLDFGAGIFTGADQWLEIGARTNGSVAAYTALSPRQALTPTPYAIMANSASNLLGSLPASQLSGTVTVGQLPSVVVTNGANGVTFNGTFGGNGAGLTSLSGAAITAGTIGNAAIGNNAINANQINGAQVVKSLNGLKDAVTLSAGANITLMPSGNNIQIAASLATPPPGMVLIPAGDFTMGDALDGESDAIPTVTVTVSAFYMDVNLVSLSQWQSVYFWATNHGYGFGNAGAGKSFNHPVQTVDWYDCVKWCNARSQQAGKTPVYYTDAGLAQVYTNGEVTVYPNWAAKGYRLPTEAEWEKAARGGLSGQRFPWGNVITENLANYYGATGSYSYDLGPNGYNAAFANGGFPYTSPVGSFASNGYGLYDMAGNVYEWCWDWYGSPYAGGIDPRGSGSGSDRMVRGGNWDGNAFNCRTAYRINVDPTFPGSLLGFRSVLPPGQ